MIFLMDVPPPLHGMSSINKSMLSRASQEKIKIKVINSVPSYFSSFSRTKLWSVLKLLYFPLVFIELFIKFFTEKSKILYRPINGGAGQIYDIAFLMLATVLCNKIYIHHHSYNYINNRSKLFIFINKLTKKKAKHIVLSTDMANSLSYIYNIELGKIIVLSNSVFFEDSAKNNNMIFDIKNNRVDEPLKIGYLANVSIDKGIDIFAEICKKLKSENYNYKAEIAGPFSDAKSKEIVERLCHEYENIKYIGPIYGEKKNIFFENLDIFIFPSKYKNEAEPLVLYEAANAGVLVIGSMQGCMKEMISNVKGLAYDIGNPISFIQNVSSKIINIDAQELSAGKKERKKSFNLLVQGNLNSLDMLMKEFLNVST